MRHARTDRGSLGEDGESGSTWGGDEHVVGDLCSPFFGKRTTDISIRKHGQRSPTQILGLLHFSEKCFPLVARMHQRPGHPPRAFSLKFRRTQIWFLNTIAL